MWMWLTDGKKKKKQINKFQRFGFKEMDENAFGILHSDSEHSAERRRAHILFLKIMKVAHHSWKIYITVAWILLFHSFWASAEKCIIHHECYDSCGISMSILLTKMPSIWRYDVPTRSADCFCCRQPYSSWLMQPFRLNISGIAKMPWKSIQWVPLRFVWGWVCMSESPEDM